MAREPKLNSPCIFLGEIYATTADGKPYHAVIDIMGDSKRKGLSALRRRVDKCFLNGYYKTFGTAYLYGYDGERILQFVSRNGYDFAYACEVSPHMATGAEIHSLCKARGTLAGVI